MQIQCSALKAWRCHLCVPTNPKYVHHDHFAVHSARFRPMCFSYIEYLFVGKWHAKSLVTLTKQTTKPTSNAAWTFFSCAFFLLYQFIVHQSIRGGRCVLLCGACLSMSYYYVSHRCQWHTIHKRLIVHLYSSKMTNFFSCFPFLVCCWLGIFDVREQRKLLELHT